MASQGARQLVRPERFEESGRGEVPRLAIAVGEGVVGDLADERLHELVLAALGRPGIDVLDEQLATDESAEARLHGGRRFPGDRGDGGQGEALPEDRRIGDDRPIRRIELVEPCRDERGQRLGHGQVGQDSPTGR